MSRKKSTRQLIGIDDIKNGSVVTADGELAFYFVHPSNLNVLPEQGVRAKVQELLGVLKGMAELELLALDSKESFQDNRQFYRQRLEEEDMPPSVGCWCRIASIWTVSRPPWPPPVSSASCCGAEKRTGP